MTHNEALIVLRCLVNMTEDETKIEALEMAIESLDEQYYHRKLEENGVDTVSSMKPENIQNLDDKV